MEDQDFKIDDLVEWEGAPGKVIFINDKSPNIRVRFDNQKTKWFLKDGRHLYWHKKPSLIKVKSHMVRLDKTVFFWMNINEDGMDGPYVSDIQADIAAKKNRISREFFQRQVTYLAPSSVSSK